MLLRNIAAAIEDIGPDALVIGVPFNMDGSEGPAAKKSRALAILLEANTGLVVHQVDERLTTFEADELMRDMDLTSGQKKARRDAIAAANILKDFLLRIADRGSRIEKPEKDEE